MKWFALLLAVTPAFSWAFTPQKSEWTILVYAAGDEIEIKEPTRMTLKRMERTPSLSANGPVRVVAIHDEVDDNEGQGDGFRYVLEHTSHPTPGSLPDTMPIPAGVVADQLNQNFSYRDIDSGDPRTLKSFLKWGVKNYPANHYILVLAGHSWGQQGLMQDFFVNGKSLDNSTMIRNYELRRVMEEVYREERENIPQGKFDLMLIDACTSGQLDVLLEWDKLFHYIAAPSLETPFNSIPYDEFLEGFIQGVQTNGAQHAGRVLEDYFLKPLVSTYVKSHARGGSLVKAETQIDAVEYFAVRTDRLAPLANALKSLVSSFPSEARDLWLRGELKDWEAIRDSDFNVDLLTLARQAEMLSAKSQWPQAQQAAQNLISVIGYPHADPTTQPITLPFENYPDSKGAWIHLEVDEIAPLREITACLTLKSFGMLNYDSPDLIPTFLTRRRLKVSPQQIACNDLGQHAVEHLNGSLEKPIFQKHLPLKNIFRHRVVWNHNQPAFMQEFPKRNHTDTIGSRTLSLWIPRSGQKTRNVRMGIIGAGKVDIEFVDSKESSLGSLKYQLPSYFIPQHFSRESLYVAEGKSSGTQFKNGLGIFMDRHLHEDIWPYVNGRMPIERTTFNDRSIEVYLGYLEAKGELQTPRINGIDFYRAHRIDQTGWPSFILPSLPR